MLSFVMLYKDIVYILVFISIPRWRRLSFHLPFTIISLNDLDWRFKTGKWTISQEHWGSRTEYKHFAQLSFVTQCMLSGKNQVKTLFFFFPKRKRKNKQSSILRKYRYRYLNCLSLCNNLFWIIFRQGSSYKKQI